MSNELDLSLQNLSLNKSEFYSNIPDLKEKMLYDRNWIKSSDRDKIIMNPREIEEYNKKSIEIVLPILDLEKYSKYLSKEELIIKINSISSPPKFERFHEDGKLVNIEYYNKLIENCNIDGLTDSNNVKYGITIRKTVMRTFPTFDKVFKVGDNYEFDRFQETSVYPVEPIVILHTSKDHKWYFAQMYNYLAWIPEKDVAVSPKEELFNYINTEHFIVTTGKRVFTNYNPLNPQLSEVKFDMGIRIPLVNIKEIENDIYGQNPTGNYVIKIPIKNISGGVEFRPALISRREEVSKGYLPYTRENIIVHAFKFLGERYGWGGTFNSRDCASLIMDVYRTMGIKLTRNSDQQGELSVGNFYKMPENMTIGDRERLLYKLKPGTPLYMEGHAMIYLGTEHGKYYIIHDFSGFYKEQKEKTEYYKVREVMVSPLNIGLTEEGKTFVEGLYGGKDFIL